MKGNVKNTTQSRSRFLAPLLGFVLLFPMIGNRANAAEPSATNERSAQPALRVIAYNVLQCSGYPKEPKSVGKASKGITEELRKQNADVIALAECPPESFIREMAEDLGMHHTYFRGGTGRWPGAILSRYPILESQEAPALRPREETKRLFTRHWGRAVIEAPFGPLVVHTAHLFRDDNPTVARRGRIEEIEVMGEVLAKEIQVNRPVVLLGDLNNDPGSTEHGMFKKLGLTDTFEQRGAGELKTKVVPADKPPRRIDYVFIGGSLREALSVRVFDKPPFAPDADHPWVLSDHLPVMADLAVPAVQP